VGRRGGEVLPERGPRDVGVRLAVSARGLVREVSRLAVVVGVPGLDGRFVEGGLLRGGVRPTEPRKGRDGLRDDHEQRQGVRGGCTQPSGTEERADMEWTSHQPQTIISH
jgi:hypothetical protein